MAINRRFVFSTTHTYQIADEYWDKFRLFAEGDGEGGGGNGDGGDAGDKGGEGGDGKGEEGDKGGENAGSEFLAGLTSDATKKFAEGSPDLEHLIGRAVTMREQLTKAIIPPAKDASDSDVAAYRKKIGVPEASDGYKIKMPEGADETPVDTEFHKALAEKFHDLNVPVATAEALNGLVNDHTLALQQMVLDQDKKFADESESELRTLWPDNYDANISLAKLAMKSMLPGDIFDEFNMVENKAGAMMSDMPIVLRAFAILGKEMETGGLKPSLNEGQMNDANDQLADLRKRQSAANDEGNSKLANRLYTEEQELIRKTQGNRGVVGAEGRAA